MVTYSKSAKQATPPLGSHCQRLSPAEAGDAVGGGVGMVAGVADGKTIRESPATLVGVAVIAGGTATTGDPPQPPSMNPTMSRSSSDSTRRAFCIATANPFLLGQRVTQAAARQASDHPAIWLLALCQALPDFAFRRISLREMAVNRLSAPP
jgi:hypothetical protein